jgi:hypothetical protein
MDPSGRFSLVRIIGGTRGAGNCAVLKKVAASTVLTWILNPVNSLSVQSLPDLVDRMTFAMMMWKKSNNALLQPSAEHRARVDFFPNAEDLMDFGSF